MTAAANSKLVTRIFSSSDQPTKAIIGLHGWTGDEHVRGLVDHDHEVGDCRAVDHAARTRPHDDADLRNDPARPDISEEDFSI